MLCKLPAERPAKHPQREDVRTSFTSLAPKRLVIASSAFPPGLPSAWEWRKKPQLAGAGWGDGSDYH